MGEVLNWIELALAAVGALAVLALVAVISLDLRVSRRGVKKRVEIPGEPEGSASGPREVTPPAH